MKVLAVTNHFAPCIGGIEKVVKDISKMLQKNGNYTEVVCLDRCPKSPQQLPEKDAIEGIKVNRIGFLDLKYYKIAPKAFEFAKGFDAIHVHGIGFFSDMFLFTKFLHKKPVIVSTYGGIFHTKNLGIAKWFYFFVWCRLVLNFSDRIVAISKNDFELFKKISNNVELSEIGVSFEMFEGMKIERKKGSFLFVGRFAPNKRITDLIFAFEKIIQQNNEVKLFIVGHDQENNGEKLRALVKENKLEGNIFVVSPSSEKELLKYFSTAEFFVSASEFESFGVSVIEAMHLGIIPVLNDIKSFRNLAKENESGFFVDFNDATGAASAILGILRKDYKSKKMVSLAAKKAADRFGWEKRFVSLERIYSDAVANFR